MRYLKLAIPYHLNYEPLNSQVQEFNIYYDKRNRLNGLIDFVHEYPDVRINVEFNGKPDFTVVDTIDKITNQVYYRINENQLRYLQEFKKRDAKFFFDSTVVAYNLCSLQSMIEMGITDVYIADDLWYNLKEVSEYCLKHKVHIRLILNHIPATYPTRGIDPKAPIFTPQDMWILDQYVDMFELDLGDPNHFNEAKCEVLYRRWFKSNDWLGQLNEINEDVQMDWPCSSYLTDLVIYRICCGRRCNSRVTNHCSKCEQFLDIARTLRDHDIKIRTYFEDDENEENGQEEITKSE